MGLAGSFSDVDWWIVAVFVYTKPPLRPDSMMNLASTKQIPLRSNREPKVSEQVAKEIEVLQR